MTKRRTIYIIISCVLLFVLLWWWNVIAASSPEKMLKLYHMRQNAFDNVVSYLMEQSEYGTSSGELGKQNDIIFRPEGMSSLPQRVQDDIQSTKASLEVVYTFRNTVLTEPMVLFYIENKTFGRDEEDALITISYCLVYAPSLDGQQMDNATKTYIDSPVIPYKRSNNDAFINIEKNWYYYAFRN